MTSVLPSHSTDIKSLLPADRPGAAMPEQTQEPTPPHIKQEDENDRGRPRSRSDDPDSNDADGAGDSGGEGDGDGNHANSSSEGHARKRRRSRKGLDKKFECPEKGCGKSYSRAEHLYRHQLNHNPKTVYRCNIGDCDRTFVRLDLCNRHKDRHTAKGSVLNRKDSLMSQVSPIAETHPPYMPAGSMSPEANRPGTAYNGRRVPMQYHSPQDGMGSPYTPITNASPNVYPHANPVNGVDYGNHDHGGYHHQTNQRPPPHHSPPGVQRPTIQTNVGHYGVLSPVSTQHAFHGQPSNTPHSATPMPHAPPQTFPPFTLPPSDFATTISSSSTTARETEPSYAPATSGEYHEQSQAQAANEMLLLDQMSIPATIPVFGNDSVHNKSPYVGMPEDFMAYLFNSPQPGDSAMGGVPLPPGYQTYGDFPNQYNGTYYGTGPSPMSYFPPSAGPQHVMSVTSLLDSNLPESIISEEKSTEIFELIRDRFHENGHAPIERQRDSILEGNRNDENHMLSRRMMQAYIGSYWLHFSDQVPVIHKPTFSPDLTPTLLLIAMMTIGAACLDRTHGQNVIKAGSQLSNFLAWHLRWEMFQDTNCRPPAKLWVFQTLLLLELYEKMYSTRELHERAHIHHATTITLMRRGRALVGKSATDSPPNLRDDKQHASRHSSTTSNMASGAAQNAEEEYWMNWITNETTRRVAFAAFVIDSIHATMFGHSTVMVAHEMRLPLPCDDKLWKAVSGAEVARIESNILSSGGRPLSFLEGLKRTLSNQEVQTNSFGRTILMAGLLSVSWHMNQRDLQVNSLGGGVSQALGGRDRWRGTLTRAFDTWKGDFDKSLRRMETSPDPYQYDSSTRIEDSIVFESRIVLHHLAHMAMHVDIVDVQIFARAKRLLGRHIGTQDLSATQRRMKDTWAPSVKARDAAYYALKFLCSVLLTDGARASQAKAQGQTGEPYSARDDVLLNRPWVLYFATLVVWCYGYALEGDCPDAPVPSSYQDAVDQMKDYLTKFCRLNTPEELKSIKGINQTTPLLMVLKKTFNLTRWELLNEGANLLDNCIQLNAGKNVS